MKESPVNSGPQLSPTDLKISAVTSKSMHLTWSPPLRPPKNYRVVYYPSKGGIPKEVRDLALDTCSIIQVVAGNLGLSRQKDETGDVVLEGHQLKCDQLIG